MNLLGHKIGLDQPFFLISGPCVVESEELQLRTAERLKAITDRLGIFFIFKSSYDKANRSSDKSFRGPGMDEGLRILQKVREKVGVPVLTDVHDIPQIEPVAQAVDMLQTPAFLARQTDFIHAVAASGPFDVTSRTCSSIRPKRLPPSAVACGQLFNTPTPWHSSS